MKGSCGLHATWFWLVGMGNIIFKYPEFSANIYVEQLKDT